MMIMMMGSVVIGLLQLLLDWGSGFLLHIVGRIYAITYMGNFLLNLTRRELEVDYLFIQNRL